MKRLSAASVVLTAIIILTSLHFCKIMDISRKNEYLTDKIYEEFTRKNWDEIDTLMDELKKLWYDNRLWASITLRSTQIDEIEISLEQCYEYSKLRAEEDFVGELKMFVLMTEHIPKQEGISLGELL